MVVYVILGVLYESFIHPLTILSTLPSAGIGALLALYAGGMDLSVIGIIGIILLIGIVKKNGIMLVDFAITEEREHHAPPVVAIRKACLLRFRPILMTTAAALLAGIPLALGTGTGFTCISIACSFGFAVNGQIKRDQPRHRQLQPNRDRGFQLANLATALSFGQSGSATIRFRVVLSGRRVFAPRLDMRVRC